MTNDRRNMFEQFVEDVVSKRCENKRTKLLSQMKSKDTSSHFPLNPKRYVWNHSSITLNKLQLEALSLGPKFCIPSSRINQIDLETQFEHLWNQTTNLEAATNEAANMFKSTIVHCSNKFMHCKPDNNKLLTKAHHQNLRNLLTNPDILLTRPDKGSGIVIMNKRDYVDKIESMLSDTTKFQHLPNYKDHSNNIELDITSLLKNLKEKGDISSQTYETIRPTGSWTPRLYGLPKIHKPGLPMRPILDMTNSPYHSTARWLTQLLEPVRHKISTRSLKDTFECVDIIEQINTKGKSMFSFDVTSLFTNVPLIETIEYICDFITKESVDLGIPLNALKELLLRCTMNVQFLFNGEYYRQVDGVAMGSPLGPLLADIFMSKLENGPLKSLIENFDLYKRYVDDILIVCNNSLNIDNILSLFNRCHGSIKFTMERESNDSLPFLDILLIKRTDGSIKRRLYRKPTWNGQYLHFQSSVPLQFKRNLVYCLANRVRKICSHDVLEDELMIVKNTLKLNGYPDQFIKAHMKEKVPKQNVSSVPKKVLYLHLPFRGNTILEIIKSRLERTIRHSYPAGVIRIVSRTQRLIPSCGKDKLTRQSKSMCIYNFTCICGARYIGRTTRQLSKRIKEHHPAALSKGTVKSINSSILQHLVDSCHQVDPNQAFNIMYQIPPNLPKYVRTKLLFIAESIAIKIHKPDLCKQKQLINTLNLPWP